MYLCKKCGNEKSFKEYTIISQTSIFDEKTGKKEMTSDQAFAGNYVECIECGADSQDYVTNKNGNFRSEKDN